MPHDAALSLPPNVADLARSLAPEIADLPRLSRVVERFLVDAGRDTSSAEDFAQALELDPMLCGWVLRQANSGFFKLNRPVTSVAQACVVIGVGPLSRLVYAACTRDLLRRPLYCYRYPGQGFWLHGLAVSAAAGKLAARAGTSVELTPEEARIAGLLHDVGKLLLDARLPRDGGPRLVTLAEERPLIDADHAQVSAAVAVHWSLPVNIIEAVAGHHADHSGPGARGIALADLLMRHWGLGIWTYARLNLEPPWRDLAGPAASLGLTRGDLEAWCAELPPILAGLEDMVRSIGHGAPPAIPVGDTDSQPAASDPESARAQRRSRRRESPRRRRRR